MIWREWLINLSYATGVAVAVFVLGYLFYVLWTYVYGMPESGE